MNIIKRITCLAAAFGCAALSYGQEIMTLEDAIHTARHNSVEALEARQAFISTYWAYRSYKAYFLALGIRIHKRSNYA